MRDEESLDWDLVNPENLEHVKTVLAADVVAAGEDADLACDPFLAMLQSLEQDLRTSLLIRSIRPDPGSGDLDVTFECDPPLIPVDVLASHLDAVREEIRRLIPELQDVVVAETWALGFDAAVSRDGDMTIYPARGSRAWPMNDLEFITLVDFMRSLENEDRSSQAGEGMK